MQPEDTKNEDEDDNLCHRGWSSYNSSHYPFVALDWSPILSPGTVDAS